MKSSTCMVWNGIAALIVGIMVDRGVAEDAGKEKQAADSNHQLELRPYHIPPGVFKTLVEIPETSSQGTNSQPREAKTAISDQELQKFFVEAGVPFPEGSFIAYNGKQDLLVVKNTPENLDLMDRVMGGPCPGPIQATVEARFLQLPRTLAEDLFADDEGLSRACIIKEKILKRIDDLARHGKITELARLKQATVSGNTAQVKAVKEFRYPTEFLAPSRASETNRAWSAFVPYQPGAFEMREIGYLLNATPTISPDGTTINLTLVPEISRVAAKLRQYTVTVPSGKLTVEQPEFSSYQTTTTVQMKSGQTMLLAVMDPVAEDGKLTQNDVVFVLLSASVIRE